jgi:hypothetical protein
MNSASVEEIGGTIVSEFSAKGIEKSSIQLQL